MRFPFQPSPALRPPASGETGLLHLQDVRVEYNGLPALDGFTLLVRAGEFLSILGRSGSGKTTALRVIAGFERVAAGYVRVSGRLVASSFVHVPPDQRRIGVVFQDYALFPHLTVAENVAFGLQDVGRRAKEEAVRGVLAMTGLGQFERRYPHELSGGQQQRVALARALAPRPVALLLDEPFSNLDRELRSVLRREVKEIVRQAGATTVLVTHDREEALSLADRVAVLATGRVEQVDTPEEVYLRPVSPDVARLIGPCEIIFGVVRGGVVETGAGAFPVLGDAGLPDGSHVQALMRAAELEMVPSTDGIDARVAFREFRGDFTEYGVRLPSGQVVRVRRHPSGDFAPGDRVAIRARPGARVIVFAEP
jgi:iron(III) transport system ATP-binding protein